MLLGEKLLFVGFMACWATVFFWWLWVLRKFHRLDLSDLYGLAGASLTPFELVNFVLYASLILDAPDTRPIWYPVLVRLAEHKAMPEDGLVILSFSGCVQTRFIARSRLAKPARC